MISNSKIYFNLFVVCLIFMHYIVLSSDCESNLKEMYNKQNTLFESLTKNNQVSITLTVKKTVNKKQTFEEKRQYFYAKNGNLCCIINNTIIYKIKNKVIYIVPEKKSIIVKNTVGKKFDALTGNPESMFDFFKKKGRYTSCVDTIVEGKFGFKKYVWNNDLKDQKETIVWICDVNLQPHSVEIINTKGKYSVSEIVQFDEPIKVTQVLPELYKDVDEIIYSSNKVLHKKFEGYYVYSTDTD